MSLEEQKLQSIKHYFKEDGFIVHSGLKYGTDFLLYTDNINKVHSKYAVVLNRNYTYLNILAIQRVCTSNRKILILVDYVCGEVVMMKIERHVFENNVMVD